MKIPMNEAFRLSIRPAVAQKFFRIPKTQRLKMRFFRQIKESSVPDRRAMDRQAVQLRNFVRIHEPHAFITITNSSEIIGKGFHGFN